jgi:hypothetical protein
MKKLISIRAILQKNSIAAARSAVAISPSSRVWKIMQEPNELWFRILQAKYMDSRVFFFHSDNKGSSQFWPGLHKVKHLFKWGALYKVGNGQHCSFWQDVWAGDVPLKI